MSSDTPKDGDSTVVNFNDKIKQLKSLKSDNKNTNNVESQGELPTDKELIAEGIVAFNDVANAEQTTGFLTLFFNKDNIPQVLWAGDIDIVSTVGLMEFVKNEFLNSVFNQINQED